MKKTLCIFLMMLLVAGAATATSAGDIKPKKCKTCGESVTLCPYKGNHPKPDTKPKQSEKKQKEKKQAEPKLNAKPKPTPKPKPNSKLVAPVDYDVTFSCNVGDAVMFIDGTEYGHPQGSHMLKSGTHTVKLTADGYQDYIYSITVAINSRRFDFTMNPLKELSFTVNGVAFKMILVKAGLFMMGTNEGDDDEKPVHQVSIMNDYYIGQTEVTQELWQAVMGNNPSKFTGNMQCPVEQVSWDDCKVFVGKLKEITGKNFRLPTEEEWEYAARGRNHENGYVYSGSNDLDKVAWCSENSADKTHPVKMKSPNELGLYDMSGNVWEWCEDRYGKDSYSNRFTLDLTSNRVIRGGSWDYSGYCRVTKRDKWIPSTRLMNLGFRIALSSSKKK